MSSVEAQASVLVRRLLTNSPMMLRLLVNSTNGITAQGNWKDRLTCDSTRIIKGSSPRPMTIREGIMVTARRSQTFILWSIKPSMMTCPASVAVVDDESPEASRAMAKATPASGPSSGVSVWWADSSE